MKIFVSNCSTWFDCDQIISQVKQHPNKIPYIGNRNIPIDDPFYRHHYTQQQITNTAGYQKSNSIEFTHYYPGEHFDKEFEIIIGNRLNVRPIYTFVSIIKPGHCAPWHYDIDVYKDKSLDDHKHLIRYFCFIGKPNYGHVFMVENESYYMEPQGNIYQYPDYNSYHAGINVGTEEKYLLSMTADRRI
jgi:hypothetical protein